MKIKDIRINPKNPRYIKDDRFRLLVKNIEGFPKMMKLRPIIIDNTGMILGGNMRYLAMVDLGYKEIPEGWVIKASELNLVNYEGFVRLLIWNKPPGSQYAGASNNNIWYSNESILVYDYSELKKNCGTEKYSYSVFESRTISEGEEGHPTTKPIDLMSWLISHYSKKNQIVLDLFGGSGSTLIACEQLDRKCFMMEVDPIYCDVIIKRWETYTNGKAVLIK